MKGGFDAGFAVEPSGGLTAEASPAFSRAQEISVAWEGDEVVSCAAAGERHEGALDASGMLVLPGLVCAHVQLGAAFLPGFPARTKEPEGARARRLLDALDADSLRAAARFAALEAAKAGSTVLFDHWRGAWVDGALDVIAEAASEVGVRIAVAADVDGTRGAAAARASIAENARFADAHPGSSRARAMMGLGDPASAGEVLQEAIGAARRREMAFHLLLGHDAAARRTLAEKGAFRPGSAAVVEGPLDEEERALLRDLHVFPVVSPRAEVGHAQTPSALTYFGSRVALGGWDSSADVLAEKAAASAARRAAGDAAFDETRAFALVAHGWDLAAEVFDVPFGRFANGAPADFVFFEPPLAAPLAHATLAAHLARLSARHVRTVVCAGETIVRDGRSTKVDEAEVRAKALEQAKRAWGRAA